MMVDDKKIHNVPVTIMLSFLYSKIKERNKGPYIKTKLLKEIIKRHFVNNKNQIGGNIKGINHVYIYDIIDDLINFNLIKRISHGTYEILPIEEQNLMIKSIHRKIKYLRKLKRNDKKISENNLKKLNAELEKIIKLIDNNSEFQILKNNSKERLRHFPF